MTEDTERCQIARNAIHRETAVEIQKPNNSSSGTEKNQIKEFYILLTHGTRGEIIQFPRNRRQNENQDLGLQTQGPMLRISCSILADQPLS